MRLPKSFRVGEPNKVPVTVLHNVICGHRANFYILSLAIEVCKVVRTWAKVEGYDGITDVPVDIWTEDESDSLLAGVKLEITLTGEIGGYCDIIETI